MDRRRRNGTRVSALTAVAVLALLPPTSHAFTVDNVCSRVQTQTKQRRNNLTRRHYRLSPDHDLLAASSTAATAPMPSLDSPDLLRNLIATERRRRRRQEEEEKWRDREDANCNTNTVFPPWLTPTGHLAETKIADLRDAMARSDFTGEESSSVLSAVRLASEGDDNKLSGAASFCAMMIETMDTGAETLIAASFHFASCVTAREQGTRLAGIGGISYWDFHQSSPELEAFGIEATTIARDAARLKRTETMAASIVRNGDGDGNGVGAGDRDGLPVKTGKSRPFDAAHANNLRSLLLSETGDWRALAIRSAACLFRLRGLLAHRGDSNSKPTTKKSERGERHMLTPEEVGVAREALHIYAPLASRLGMHRLKNELEGAAFRVLYRRQHAAVEHLYSKEALAPILAEVRSRVRDVLRDVSPPLSDRGAARVTVSARVKEPFSMWRKMLRTRARSVADVPDAVALRVVLDGRRASVDEDKEVTRARERALCYHVQRLCVDNFAPAEEPRFKDYVEDPKPNGYQSLHYTATVPWKGGARPFEIQVRSGEMHRVAEFGLAAHWDYKLQGKKKKSGGRGGKGNRGGGAGSCRRLGRLDRSSKGAQEWHRQRTQSEPSLFASSVEGNEYSSRSNVDDGDVDGINAEGHREERIRARAERLAPYIEALREARFDLARERVFVFLSSAAPSSSSLSADAGAAGGGRILSLPSGSCVLDAVREMERQQLGGGGGGGATSNPTSGGYSSDRGDGLVGMMLHNGEATSMTRRLRNGDVLSVAP